MPFDTVGTLNAGGRFNPIGLFAPLYTSLNPWVACIEVLDRQPEIGADLIVHQIDVRLRATLDIREPAVISSLAAHGLQRPLQPLDVTTGSTSLPIAITALAYTVGIDGILAPSAAWHRHADSRSTLLLDSRIEHLPPEDPGNLIILQDDEGRVAAHIRPYYEGHVRFGDRDG
jgi:RES domain-containing protein